jgi:digeranylgeranylglycerophospholipid reductase
MKEYDIIVVGAGPAGSMAAKAAATLGAATILVEEHTQIGIPQHCLGLLHGTISGITEKILETMDNRVVLSKIKAHRIYSPAGKMIEIPQEDAGCYVVDRALFDMQLAAQAVHAGAEILVNTKVTGLMYHSGKVCGVTTSSRNAAKIKGKVVIAADGIRAILKGIPKWAGLAETSVEIVSGITWWLTGVNDIEPGTLEFHLGSFGGKRGCIWLLPQDSSTCISDFPSLEALELCRQGDRVISDKIGHAVPVRITGWAHPLYLGKPLIQKVKQGLLLAGSAAGYNGILTCLLSGQYAGKTAAEAVKEFNVSEARLVAYEQLCQKLQDSRKMTSASFFKRTNDDLENIFDEMTRMDDPGFNMLAL